MDQSNYVRWTKYNILQPDIIQEDTDYVLPTETTLANKRGRPSQDYWLSILLAYSLCLQAKTKQGALIKNSIVDWLKMYSDWGVLLFKND